MDVGVKEREELKVIFMLFVWVIIEMWISRFLDKVKKKECKGLDLDSWDYLKGMFVGY